MRRVSSTYLQSHTAAVLRLAEGGESIEITRHGRVVLLLVPEREAEREACSRAMDQVESQLARLRPIRMTLNEMLAARREGLL